MGSVIPFVVLTARINPGTDINYAERTSPHRTKLIYKGLVYLPEKCNRWYFSVARTTSSQNGAAQYYPNDATWISLSARCNIDSFSRSLNSGCVCGDGCIEMPIGCSMNNTDFSDNNSARFLSEMLYYNPIHKEVEYNPGAFSPDHDSLVVSIPDTILNATGFILAADPWGGGTFHHKDTAGNYVSEIITYNHFFSPIPGATYPNPVRFNAQNNPFDTDSTFRLIDSTGRVTFTAQSEIETHSFL